MVGKTLGHYEILEPLGKGGMGEVYRARDTTLDRDVAIKVLPEELAADPDRLARLEREAHSLAALNHPNVATIHGLEEAEDIRFLVLELVEGDTLAERLHTGPLEVEEALGIAQQIAEGLEAAHANGIVHRDLKPANIKVTPEGRVKVLDFGLAKPTEAEGDGAEGLTHSPTATVAGTAAGVLLGTAPYMSPEQVRGRLVDKRTDIWAFGCVLYEMLTGRQPFLGDDVTETIASIVKEEPDWSLLPSATPPLARSVIRRCLRKDPNRRVQDLADARIEIEEALGETPAPVLATGEIIAPAATWRRALPWKLAAPVAAALVGVTALLMWLAMRPAPPVPEPVRRFEIELPEDVFFSRTGRHIVAVSPDGSRIAFTGNAQLWIRSIDDLEATPLRGTDDPTSPFFSPDGQQLGFWSAPDGQIKRAP